MVRLQLRLDQSRSRCGGVGQACGVCLKVVHQLLARAELLATITVPVDPVALHWPLLALLLLLVLLLELLHLVVGLDGGHVHQLLMVVVLGGGRVSTSCTVWVFTLPSTAWRS